MVFSLYFTRTPFAGQTDNFILCYRPQAQVAYKDNYCFPKASAIKNIMLLRDPGRKEKTKYEGKKEKEEREKRKKGVREKKIDQSHYIH